MQQQTENPPEMAALSAALALLGVKGGSADLHRTSVSLAKRDDHVGVFDIFRLNSLFQAAVVDGLSKDGPASVVSAWPDELKSLPVPGTAF